MKSGTDGLIEHYELLKFSRKQLYYSVVKEYLLEEMENISNEITKESENAAKNKVPSYLISIFVSKLKDRYDFLNHLCKEVLHEISIEKEAIKANETI